MLTAIIKGKAGRLDFNTGDENIRWRELFKTREDLLTAAVFSRWSYLSNETQHHLMHQWFSGKGDFKKFQGIEFWPKYDLPDNKDRQSVEPDVLIKFEGFNVLIEVKPPSGGNQYLEQWKNEIEGYYSCENNKDIPLYFLAIGRIKNVKYRSNNEFFPRPALIHAISWKIIAHTIYDFSKSTNNNQDRRILKDVLEALGLYGVVGHKFLFRDFFKPNNKLPSLELSYFQRWK